MLNERGIVQTVTPIDKTSMYVELKLWSQFSIFSSMIYKITFLNERT